MCLINEQTPLAQERDSNPRFAVFSPLYSAPFASCVIVIESIKKCVIQVPGSFRSSFFGTSLLSSILLLLLFILISFSRKCARVYVMRGLFFWSNLIFLDTLYFFVVFFFLFSSYCSHDTHGVNRTYTHAYAYTCTWKSVEAKFFRKKTTTNKATTNRRATIWLFSTLATADSF